MENMSSPSSPMQEVDSAPKTADAPLPVAIEGQLQWILRPLSSLSTVSSAKDGEKSSSIWWPSILFNDYSSFEEFFPEEFDGSEEESKTKRLISSRHFQNTINQRSVMVARLLGRPMSKFVELIQVDDDSEEIEEHQATQWVLFKKLPQEIFFSQMQPEAFSFTVESDSATNEESKIIDDELYMSFMYALDLAYTKRMGGPHSHFDAVGTQCREMGRKRLADLPSNTKKLSEQGSISQKVKFAAKEVEIGADDVPKSHAPDVAEPVVEEKAVEASKVDIPAASATVGQTESNESADAEKNIENKSKDAENKENKPLAATPKEAPIQSPKKAKRGRPNATVTLPENVPTSPIRKKRVHGTTPKKVASPQTPKMENQNVYTPADAMAGPLLMTPLPTNGSIVSDSSSPEATIAASTSPTTLESMTVKSDDSFEEVCEKLKDAGWTIDTDSKEYLCPDVSYDDMKKNPDWKNKKFFVNNLGFCKYLRRTFGWKRSTTSKPQTYEEVYKKSRPKIKADDTFEEVCKKLKVAGWTIDTDSKEYLGPDVSRDDMKKNPDWKNKKFFKNNLGFCKYLRRTFGWKGSTVTQAKKETSRQPKKTTTPASKRKRTNTVTPSSNRPKRSRRSPAFVPVGVSGSPKMIDQLFKFNSEDEEEFYHFPTLIKKLTEKCGWKYKSASIQTWQYILPDRPSEGMKGNHLEDFFYEEAEVVQYCMNNNYYERRHELGL